MTKKHQRSEYGKHSLAETDIKHDPVRQFALWWQEAIDAGVNSLDAAILATVDQDLRPDARVVLVKSFDERGFTFYTNYESKKALQLRDHPFAALTIFWSQLERQIRVRGRAIKTSRDESIEYFKSRPQGAQISAWASPQSRALKDRHELERNFLEAEQHFLGKEIPCPLTWGGFRLVADYFEFWQGGKDRLHDRFAYELHEGHWHVTRLAP